MAVSSLVILLFFLVAVHGDGDITCSSACRCSGANYTIDLSTIKFPPNVTDSANAKFKYSINPCNPFPCYGKPSVVCQYGAKDPTTGIVHPNSCGIPNGAMPTLHSYSPLNFSIEYTGGQEDRLSIITFVHVQASSSVNINGKGSTINLKLYEFTVTGDLSKVIQPKTSGGVAAGVIGIVIIILALVALVTYFIGGMAFMYFVRGARGVEMVPNLVFWKDFPILIKDGFTLTFGPCVRALSKEQAYEKI